MTRACTLAAASPYAVPTKPVCAPIRYQPRASGSRGHSEAEIANASRVLNICGVRLIPHEGQLCLGIWEDVLDSADLRRQIKVLGLAELPILALDGPEVPLEFKVRSCPDRRRDEPFQAWLRRAEQAAHSRQEKVPA